MENGQLQKSIEDDFFENFEKYPQNHDYAAITNALNTNSTSLKGKVLDKLLGQIVDTKHSLWGELSQGLAKCFANANNDIFSKSLKLHHRLISYPNTTCDGYLSLLKSTSLLLNSRYYSDASKSRVVQSLYLVIGAHGVVTKSLLHASLAMIDEIVTAFVGLLTHKSVFEWFAVLDTRGLWLRNFAYGSYIRSIFFGSLIKNTDFLKEIADNFLKKSGDESKIYGTFLIYLWRYQNGNLLPEMKVETIVQSGLRKLRKLDLFTDLFLENPYLVTPKLLDVLVEPLSTINRCNIKISLEPNLYIFEIVANIAKTNNCDVLFSGCNKLRKGRSTRSCANLPQKITDLTLLSIRENDVRFLSRLLNCCLNVYGCRPAALAHVNPARLLESLYDLYRLSWRNDLSLRDAILSIFKFFYSESPSTLKILGGDNEILTDLWTFHPPNRLLIVANRLSLEKGGFEFLKNHQTFVKPYLEEVWSSFDDRDYANLIFFAFSLKLTTRGVVALLCEDDDGTVVESDRQSSTLAELMEKCFERGDPDEEFLALLVLKVLVTNLDVLLYFEANHQAQAKLESCDEGSEIIDSQSTLRRSVLCYIEQIGFVSDQKRDFLTKTELQDVPKIFDLLQITNSELGRFLESSNGSESIWLVQARKAFKNSLRDFDPLLFPLLLEQFPKTCVYRKTEFHWPPSDSVYYQLHPEDFCGISLIVNYGLKVGLLKNSEGHRDNLAFLIKQSRAFLGHRPENFANFDWFVGVVFLICGGRFDDCKSILINFTNTQVTSLVWATFGKEFDGAFQEHFFQNLGVVLNENSSSFQALKILGLAPDIVVQSWLNQCFFNILEFGEIYNYLIFSLLYPAECLLYYTVAIFTHLNERICKVTHSPTVENIVYMTEMGDFKLANYMESIENLMKRYRNSYKL